MKKIVLAFFLLVGMMTTVFGQRYAYVDTDYILEQIQKLPTAYRIVFNLFAIEGFSHREIAIRLEIQESTSRSQYLRARQMLQAYLSSSFVNQKKKENELIR